MFAWSSPAGTESRLGEGSEEAELAFIADSFDTECNGAVVVWFYQTKEANKKVISKSEFRLLLTGETEESACENALSLFEMRGVESNGEEVAGDEVAAAALAKAEEEDDDDDDDDGSTRSARSSSSA